jgi:hypothetical protein
MPDQGLLAEVRPDRYNQFIAMLDEKTGPKLLGVDVGFSAKRPTTGIAVLNGEKIHLARAGTSWESRARHACSSAGSSIRRSRAAHTLIIGARLWRRFQTLSWPY